MLSFVYYVADIRSLTLRYFERTQFEEPRIRRYARFCNDDNVTSVVKADKILYWGELKNSFRIYEV